jgi:Domain of unknown function (DUF6933)
VYTVRGTRKFLGRAAEAVVPETALQASTTMLGDWYLTVLFWRPQVALFVNEATLLPLLAPLAPAVSVIARMRDAAAAVFTSLGLNERFISQEIAEMNGYQLAKTSSRSVLGSMNDFASLARAHRDAEQTVDLIDLSLRLAGTPCGPLYNRHVSPDRELLARSGQHVPRSPVGAAIARIGTTTGTDGRAGTTVVASDASRCGGRRVSVTAQHSPEREGGWVRRRRGERERTDEPVDLRFVAERDRPQ